MSPLSLPKTLIPNTPENVSDAQANFDALTTAVNNVLGDVTGSLDNLSVDKVTKQQLRTGLGGTVESTSVTSIVLRSNFDPASGHLIDQTSPSWELAVGGSDEVVISRAAATSGLPSYSTVLTIDSSGISGITTTVADRSITGTKVALNTLRDENVASNASITESKIDLASDATATTASRRTLGTGSTQAAAGNHTHTGLSIQAAGTASVRKIGTGATDAAAGNHTHSTLAPKDSPTFTSGITVGGGVHVSGGGLTVDAGPTSLGGTLTADGVGQFNNGLNVDGAGTTLDGGTFEVQPLQGGGFSDSEPARFKVTATGVSFHGNTPITRRTINGARDEPDATGALENVLNFLDDLGLIHDNTTAH